MKWENNPENWVVSETKKPYSFDEINLLVDSSEDIFENGQLRLMINLKKSNKTIGTLDFFQADFIKKTVHLGILIAEQSERRKGFSEEAIKLATNYVTNELYFEKIYCTIQSFNKPSLELFKKCGFDFISNEKENPIFEVNSSETNFMCLCLKK